MALTLIFGLSLIALASMLVLRSFALGRADRRRTLDQIAVYGFGSTTQLPEETADIRKTLEDLAATTGARALGRFESLRSGESKLRELLNSAGMYQTSVASFVGTRILATLAGAALALLFSVGGTLNVRLLAGCCLLTLIGWFMPLVRVQRLARLRLERIDREVPELVDLLVTTVEAGVGFAAALQLASRSIEGPLGVELRLALREQSLGLTPEEALRNLAVRVSSPATRAFTQALVQGETLGVSIGTILRDLAIDMRKRRRQSAEERAQKTPTKILFPLIALILPAMFIISLGPVLLEIVRFLGSSYV
jgi:tight adherence protein C